MDHLEPLRNWLNGKAEYWQGVHLYRIYGHDDAMAAIFAKGPTDFTSSKIFPYLKEIYDERTKDIAGDNAAANDEGTGGRGNQAKTIESRQKAQLLSGAGMGQAGSGGGMAKDGRNNDAACSQQGAVGSEFLAIAPNQALIDVCDNDANKQWKNLMNKRAGLFALVRRTPAHEDINTPARVAERGPLALEILSLSKIADKAYDQLAYVRAHGKLPHEEAAVADDYAFVPDANLKHTINNIQKNLSKLRGRELTPARANLIAKHEKSVEALQTRWNKIKARI